MKLRDQRVWLTAVAVAGSIALYGCGGGSGGPDTTPYDQDYVDQKTDEAKKAEEERLAAIRAATEAAGKAATAAKNAADAEKDAEDAAIAAATLAVYETLDADEAAAQSTIAANAKKAADAALVAANDALAEADAVIHSDPEVTNQQGLARASATAAAESARDAEKHANAASTSAQVAQATKDGINAANNDAQEQGRQRKIAANRASDADAAAKTAVEKATEAKATREALTTEDTVLDKAEAAVAAAKTALAAAEKALADNTMIAWIPRLRGEVATAKADLFTKVSAAVKARSDQAAAAQAAAQSAAAAVSEAQTASDDASKAARDAGDTEQGSPGAMSAAAAAESHQMALTSANTAQGWSDVVAAIMSQRNAIDLETALDDLTQRIPWAEDYSLAADLSDRIDAAQYAAERLAEQTDPDSDETATYQEDLRDALQAVMDDLAGIEAALAAARTAHDAAKPWAENGYKVDNATGAEGENLASGNILINPEGRVLLQGKVVVADAESTLDELGPHDYSANFKGGWNGNQEYNYGIVSVNGRHQFIHDNRWAKGDDKVYDYISYGLWGRYDGRLPSSLPADYLTDYRTTHNEGGVFVLVKDGAPATVADAIGRAKFTGRHIANREHFGIGTVDPDVWSFNVDEGNFSADINFAEETAELRFSTGSKLYLKVSADVNGNELSGAEITDIDRTEILSTREHSVSLHAAVFGERAEELAGTIRMSGRYHQLGYNWYSAFGARNDEYR